MCTLYHYHYGCGRYLGTSNLQPLLVSCLLARGQRLEVSLSLQLLGSQLGRQVKYQVVPSTSTKIVEVLVLLLSQYQYQVLPSTLPTYLASYLGARETERPLASNLQLEDRRLGEATDQRYRGTDRNRSGSGTMYTQLLLLLLLLLLLATSYYYYYYYCWQNVECWYLRISVDFPRRFSINVSDI